VAIRGGTDTSLESKIANGHKPDASRPDGFQSRWPSFANSHHEGGQQLHRKSPDAGQPERTFLRLAEVQDTNKFENHLVGRPLTWSFEPEQPLDITAYKEARGDLRAFMEDGWKDGHGTAAALSVHNDYMYVSTNTESVLDPCVLTGRFPTKGAAQSSIDSLVQFFKLQRELSGSCLQSS
jgi:hypothetical protein